MCASPRTQDVTAADLRNTMGAFTTGVAIVTTEHDGELHGMTVNSLTSVSLEPPLVLVCLMNDARCAAAVTGRGTFVINVLRKRQDAIADRFARRGERRFVGLDVERDALGMPYIPKAVARLGCTVEEVHPGGDHVIVVGRVTYCESAPGTPLVFYRGNYHEITGEGRPAPWYW